jgi:regulator of RNase E activity RraA
MAAGVRSILGMTSEILRSLTTATITTILLKKGIRNTWMRGPMPFAKGQDRVVGKAFTLRFVPMREDLATPQSWTNPISTRHAIENMPKGAITVVDAMGVTDAGILGDLLIARMKKLGVKALITDGVIRDSAGVAKVELPLWCAGVAAPPAIARLTFVGWQEPIACGGVAIFPNDVIVADGDGAVVIPDGLVDHVVEVGPEQERLEGWLLTEIDKGAKLPGLYPPEEETRARYEAWKANEAK